MPLIHAYRRKAPHTVEFAGETRTFEANPAGEQVCDVPAGPMADRLLELTEGYRLHASEQPQAAPPDDEDEPPSPFVLTSEGDDGNEVLVDLRTLDRARLLAFCAENDIPAPHPNAKDDTVRQKIVDFLAGV